MEAERGEIGENWSGDRLATGILGAATRSEGSGFGNGQGHGISP
jgi:hypothetical protein